MALQSTYFLVAHGSRDPRPQAALERLGQLFHNYLADRLITASSNPTLSASSMPPLVGTGVLELGPTPLDEQIKQFGESTLSAGLNQIQLLPLFLLPGVHVTEDIPMAATTAQQSFGEKIQIELRPYLGIHQGLIHLLANQMARLSTEAWILLAHGSRREGGNAPVEVIARALTHQFTTDLNSLQVIPAYWSVLPSLEMQVAELATSYNQIGILPYFLFPGRTTDAIAAEVERLRSQFPQVKLRLANPLIPNAGLVNLILDLAQLP